MKVIRKENSNLVYYIDEEKKSVVAKLDIDENDLELFISSFLNKATMQTHLEELHRVYHYDIARRWYLKHKMNNITGKAMCCSKDTFDEAFGMRLAKTRCLRKFYDILSREFQELANNIYDFYDEIENIENLMWSKKNKRAFEEDSLIDRPF